MSALLLTLDLLGVFAFALNGALTALRLAKLDVVGVITLGMMTALGGGILRDVLMGALPPLTFDDWRYLAVAALGSLVAFAWGTSLDRLRRSIEVLDAMGLSLFAVTGAVRALDLGMGPGQAVLLGALTAVGGGTLRDVMIGRVPVVMRRELYAIPALLAAFTVVVCHELDLPGLPSTIGAATLCLVIRLLGVRFDLHAPRPRRPQE